MKLSQKLSQSLTAFDNLQHDGSSHATSEVEEDDKRSAFSDELIPLAEWPPSSPDRDLLPRDSSIGSIQRSDKEAKERDSHSALNTRKSKRNSSDSARSPSSVSSSPSADMSGRRDSIRKVSKDHSINDMSDAPSARRRYPTRTARSSSALLSSSRQSPECDHEKEEDDIQMISREEKLCQSNRSIVDFKKSKIRAMNNRSPVSIIVSPHNPLLLLLATDPFSMLGSSRTFQILQQKLDIHHSMNQPRKIRFDCQTSIRCSVRIKRTPLPHIQT